MEANIRTLMQACEQLGLSYRFFDKDKICLLVAEKYLFHNNRSPFNSESMAVICKDKEHQYALFNDHVNMPKTRGYLDPATSEQYQHYRPFNDQQAIVADIESQFNYPVVVKKNRGALGCHVFKCNDRAAVAAAVEQCFDRTSLEYDYVVLAQQYIPTEMEMRVIFFDGEPLLAYERYFANSDFGARYWETAEGKTISLVDDERVKKAAELFKYATTFPGLRFVGLDIIIAKNGDYVLIELNSGPKVNHFINNHGEQSVISMYEKILTMGVAPHLPLDEA